MIPREQTSILLVVVRIEGLINDVAVELRLRVEQACTMLTVAARQLYAACGACA